MLVSTYQESIKVTFRNGASAVIWAGTGVPESFRRSPVSAGGPERSYPLERMM